MHSLEKIARLEEVLDLLDEINMMFAVDPGSIWNHAVEGDPGYRRLEFLVKIATAIGILQNQVEYEKNQLTDGSGDQVTLIQ